MKKKPLIVFKNISKSYGNKLVIENFNLTIYQGSFVTILGPSGCGKSTILKMLGGFESPTKGNILLNNLDIKDMPIYQRPTATVFQDYALFPTMNVFQNVAYGLKGSRISVNQVTGEIREKLKILYDKAVELSQTKLVEFDKKKQIVHHKIVAAKKKLNNVNHKGWSYRYYHGMLKVLEEKLNDLDYYTSYWQTYPLSKTKKHYNKYLTRKISKEEIANKVFQVINLVGLKGSEFLMPNQLSGGMQQRVALARAIVTLPKILLLDEPLSALDSKIRKQLQHELKRLHKVLGITFILVTHDQEEALVVSDQVVVMSKGKIEQVGLPDEVYDSPANFWVANFIGEANLFDGVYLTPGKVQVYDQIFETDVVSGFKYHQKVKLMMRPEDFDVVPVHQGIINVYVESITYLGKLWKLRCRYQNKTLFIENIDHVPPKTMIGLVWDKMDVHVMGG